MSSVSKIIFGFAMLAMPIMLIGCGDDNNHAPGCQYGQALVYNVPNNQYRCQPISLASGLYGGNGFNQVGNINGAITPPIAVCPKQGTELLGIEYSQVGRIHQWSCPFSDAIRPGENDSPSADQLGRGGEPCNGESQIYANNFGNQNQQFMTNIVSCPGRYQRCSTSGNFGNTFNPNYNNQNFNNQNFNGQNNVYGQMGECQQAF